jgi:hypothetical protein
MAWEPIRLAWSIDGKEGHGESFISTVENIKLLNNVKDEMNAKYGYGTHWIEYKPEGSILSPNTTEKYERLTDYSLFSSN